MPFLLGEWSEVVEPWMVLSAEDYAKVPRLGRKTRLGAKQREAIWPLIGRVRDALKGAGPAHEHRGPRQRCGCLA